MNYDGTFSVYQSQARKTAIYPEDFSVIYPALGICGEAGEAADIVKKSIRDNGGAFTHEQRERLRKEIGDILWYASNLCSDMGWKLEEVARENLKKLADRQERGVLSGSGDNR